MTLRRLTDIAAAALGLLLAAPLLALIAATVAILDGRPVFFTQTRSGLDGRPIRIAKFRTMGSGRDGFGRLLPDGERVTPLGRLLRRTRLDEPPQLWSLLVGDMSLVGPRPLLPETIAEAGEAGRQRGRVRPGLTGLAQVSGNTLLSTQEKIALDNWYINNRSLALDAAILWRTLRVVVLGEQRDADMIERTYARGSDRRG